MRKVRFTVTLVNERRQPVSNSTFVVEQLIPAGGYVDAPTGIGPFQSTQAMAARVALTIDSAAIPE